MSERLFFTDTEGRDDALTFASRAARLLDPVVRLQAAGGAMAMTAAALTPRNLLDATPTVLAMRVVAVDPELECDVTVDAAQLAAEPGQAAIVLPESGVRTAWAGIAPPRGGWSESATLDAASLAARAADGMARVASALPADAGEEIVQSVRASIWGESIEEWGGLALGVAFAAVALGFISGAESARVFTSGPWTRVSLSRGHLLVRGPVAMGLTAIRRTGGA